MNGYLVPANAKKGTLIFNIFRPFDLIMFGIGAFVSLMSLVIVNSNDSVLVLISCLPVAVTGLLVVPIPYYHNVLTILRNVISFFTSRQQFVWKGWCVTSGEKDDE